MGRQARPRGRSYVYDSETGDYLGPEQDIPPEANQGVSGGPDSGSSFGEAYYKKGGRGVGTYKETRTSMGSSSKGRKVLPQMRAPKKGE